MTPGEHLTEYNEQRNRVMDLAERYAKQAFLRACKVSRKRIAVILGVEEHTVTVNARDNEGFFSRLEAFYEDFMPRPLEIKIDGEELNINSAEYSEHAQKRLGKMLTVIDRALISHDLHLAMDAAKEMHKVLGMTTRVKVEHSGRVGVDVKVLPSPGFLQKLRAFQPAQIKGDVEEAEVV